jgi:3-deoxy-manno-octulosonate cytidylyltransferase (CMP-KDO synthetase)
MKTLTIIPSRLSATRLPGKPLLKINNLSIISHVFIRAQEANIGDVVVATEDQEIVDDVNQKWWKSHFNWKKSQNWNR